MQYNSNGGGAPPQTSQSSASNPQSGPDDARSLFLQLASALYGPENILAGTIKYIERKLRRGAAPLLVCVVEPRLSKKQVQRVREWVSEPRYPFNVVVFTGSPVAGLPHGGGR